MAKDPWSSRSNSDKVFSAKEKQPAFSNDLKKASPEQLYRGVIKDKNALPPSVLKNKGRSGVSDIVKVTGVPKKEKKALPSILQSQEMEGSTHPAPENWYSEGVKPNQTVNTYSVSTIQGNNYGSQPPRSSTVKDGVSTYNDEKITPPIPDKESNSIYAGNRPPPDLSANQPQMYRSEHIKTNLHGGLGQTNTPVERGPHTFQNGQQNSPVFPNKEMSKGTATYSPRKGSASQYYQPPPTNSNYVSPYTNKYGEQGYSAFSGQKYGNNTPKGKPHTLMRGAARHSLSGSFSEQDGFEGIDEANKGYEIISQPIKGAHQASGVAKGTTKGSTAAKSARAAGEKAKAAAENIAKSVRWVVRKIAAHPVASLVIGGIVGGLLVLFLVIIPSISSMILTGSTTATVKNLMDEDLYTEITEHIRAKDAAISEEFEEYEKKSEYADILEEHIEKEQEVAPATSIKLMTTYLYAKYEDSLTLDIAKGEINAIHEQLYIISSELGTTEIDIEPDEDEDSEEDEDDNDNEEKETTKTVRTLTVYLKGQTLREFFEENLEVMLTAEQFEFYEYFLFIATLWGGDWCLPFEVGTWECITQEFGVLGVLDKKPHRGTDFAKPEGTEILSVCNGTVVTSTSHESWGIYVKVESEDGSYSALYAHMISAAVNEGEQIIAGDVIGYVGSTGTSTGNHLHLEIEENGVLIDCREVLPEDE